MPSNWPPEDQRRGRGLQRGKGGLEGRAAAPLPPAIRRECLPEWGDAVSTDTLYASGSLPSAYQRNSPT